MARLRTILALGVVVSGLAAAGPARAISFSLPYEAHVVSSDVPNVAVGAIVTDNLLAVASSTPHPVGDFDTVDEGVWVLAGLLSFDLDGFGTFREAPDEPWRFELSGQCNACWVLFNQDPSSGFDLLLTAEILLEPGDGDGAPPIPFASGTQTLTFSSDIGLVLGTIEAVLVPAPPLAIHALALAAFGVARRGRP